MLVEIRGRDLPGRRFAEHTNVHVGVQRRREVIETWAGDSLRARWEFAVTVTDDGDVKGPHVHGRRGNRYAYLSWVDVAPDGTVTMFRRARLMFAAVPAAVLAAAGRTGWRLVGDLGLTDAEGRPVANSLRPPAIAWSAAWPV